MDLPRYLGRSLVWLVLLHPQAAQNPRAPRGGSAGGDRAAWQHSPATVFSMSKTPSTATLLLGWALFSAVCEGFPFKVKQPKKDARFLPWPLGI